MTCQGDESPIVRNNRQNNRQGTASRERETGNRDDPFALGYEGVKHEGQSIREEDLQQVQNHQAKRNRSGYLREQKTQTEARLEEV
jgi:hypothetical protein